MSYLLPNRFSRYMGVPSAATSPRLALSIFSYQPFLWVCGFNLHFILHGSVAASGMKLGPLMKEVTTDICLHSLSRDVVFLLYFRNNLFTEPGLKVQSPLGSYISRNRVIVSRPRHMPKYHAGDIVYWYAHLFDHLQIIVEPCTCQSLFRVLIIYQRTKQNIYSQVVHVLGGGRQ